jgi:uncharacterized protein (DUF111 family)
VALGTPNSEPALDKSHVVVEANVDDMTGELAAHALSQLLGAGALDAWATPVVMKKGRPGLVISALAAAHTASHVADALLRETSTIGVRFSEVGRRELTRRLVEVQTDFGQIPVKVSGDRQAGTPPQIKPEFDACARAARERGVQVRVVIQAALKAAEELDL